MLSELLLALDEVEDSLGDLHIPALATASFRAHVLRYQLLLNSRCHDGPILLAAFPCIRAGPSPTVRAVG